MARNIKIVWIVTLVISLAEGIFEFLPRAIGALLPLMYLSLSLVVFRKLQIGYRIVHLIFVVQFILYALFITVFNYGDIVSGKDFFLGALYSQFTTVIFVYIVFLIVFGISYAPYSYIQRRKLRNA
jgi:hypothetical protein